MNDLNSMYKLSIIIPHYNSPQYLERLLSTIPKNNEIQTIVVDDRSDKCIEQYNDCKKKYESYDVLFLENREMKKGAGTCRNIGLKHAKGEWILFADADDYFLKEMYSSIILFLQEKEADIVYFSPTSINGLTGEKGRRHYVYESLINEFLENPNHENDIRLRYKYGSPCSKLIRLKLILAHDIKFDEIIVSNDIMFSTKVGFYANKINACNNTIYCITENENTLTTIVNLEFFDIRNEVFINKYKYLKERLSKTDFDNLKLCSLHYVIKAIKNGYGIKKAFLVYLKMRKNKIGLINIKFLNRYIIKNELEKLYKRLK